ncbi:MAG TPA: Mur ligase family protein [Polyangiaceae bacterium]|jgi:UDP-N-acetylmuramate: L-alanyl-gamma-D-glutamyl-meso-diaminopimelate ligase
MRVHLVGVSGTGMGALAALLVEAGHAVSGSDVAFDPPIGPALEALAVRCLRGYDASHLDDRPDLVVVGNAIRRDNPEALAAERLGLKRTSMSGALREHFLAKRRPLVVAGTHGKTTTSAMCAWLLSRAGFDPGWFIGGIPKGLDRGAAIGSTRVRPSAGGRAPFVVEGDEYDAVYWHKQPKFLDYIGVGPDDVAIVTSIELDHIDIYPDVASYEAAFRAFVRAVPPQGLLVCDARDPRVRAVVQEEARGTRIAWYALERDDTGDVTPTWLGAPASMTAEGAQQFDLFAGGMSCGRCTLGVPGRHNVRNALAALAACVEGLGASLTDARSHLASFEGVRRRQDLLGEPGGVRVYDDFAHHPTAVDETLRALRSRHPQGKLWVAFEPRSATACRALHQEAYAHAFDAADQVLLAPLGRTNIPEGERLDLAKLAAALGDKARVMRSLEAILACVVTEAKRGDTVALFSNGAFGGLHGRLLTALGERDAG